jgi:large subunit ribosomal protein L3
MKFIIGRKLEMTQHFRDDGSVVPVTLVKAAPCVVTQVRNAEKDGYVAVQIGCEEAKGLNKPEAGHLKNLPQVSTLREFRVDSTELNRGDKIEASVFEPGDKIDVVGASKGRGFQGVVKRHGFHGSPASHGHKDQLRMPGSIASRRQGPVAKGKRMAGHMGDDQVTVKNLEIVSVDAANNVLAVKGAVPGARGTLILIKTREGKKLWQK